MRIEYWKSGNKWLSYARSAVVTGEVRKKLENNGKHITRWPSVVKNAFLPKRITDDERCLNRRVITVRYIRSLGLLHFMNRMTTKSTLTNLLYSWGVWTQNWGKFIVFHPAIGITSSFGMYTKLALQIAVFLCFCFTNSSQFVQLVSQGIVSTSSAIKIECRP